MVDQLWVAFLSHDPSNRILVSSFDIGWTADTPINQTSQSSPSLALFSNRLYVAFLSQDSTNRLLVSSSADGANWTPSAQINQESSQFAPALAAFNDRLYAAFISRDPTNRLLVSSSADGATWTPSAQINQETSQFAPRWRARSQVQDPWPTPKASSTTSDRG